MTTTHELIAQVVTAIKEGEITIKDIIKNLVPKQEKKSKLNRSKEEIKAYQREWYQKNKEYVLTKVKLQTEEKKKINNIHLKELNELRQKYEALESKGVLEQPQYQDQHPSEP
jgi:hypothetical protein